MYSAGKSVVADMRGNTRSAVMDLDKALRGAYRIFRKYDEDKSGTLDHNEILNLLQTCNIAVTEQECRECLRELDTNGDGVWDFTEFMTFLGMIYSIKLSASAEKMESNENKEDCVAAE